MPIFQYEAIDSKSDVTTGSIEAANKADAAQQLRANGLFPKQIVEKGKGKLKATKGKKRGGGRSRSKKGDTEDEKVGSSGCPLFMGWVGLMVSTLFCFLLLRVFPSLEPEEVVWYPFKKWWMLLIVGIFLGGYVGILIERKLPKSKSKD
ncbi:MAG: hypothetical protein ABGZ19_12785 [Verrucomicrobiales bacterium]|nr:hypothetical protein [Verrucomicrobiales bacterium]HIL74120.1 hypothetical protein [Rhodospirillales bacterium]